MNFCSILINTFWSAYSLEYIFIGCKVSDFAENPIVFPKITSLLDIIINISKKTVIKC